ncbi:MAG TPA: ABC transporter permease, partial [Alphaproteobacteria bacterium]|nr:ABC transporter permease [Alphaproteobacteria bacterium]
MQSLFQDLRFGLRALAKNPGFSAIAIITLALGIGANTAVFSIVNALILRPFPFPNLDQLVLVRASGANVVSEIRIAPADFADLQRDSRIFQGVAAFQLKEANLTGAGDAETVVVSSVTPDFFAVIGAQPLLGRGFAAEEAEPGRDDVIVLNHGFWQRRFAGDDNLLGKQLEMDGRKMTVAGIMPADFNYPVAVDFWVPLALSTKAKAERNIQTTPGSSVQVLGRLRPEIGLGQAQAEMQAMSVQLAKQFPESHQGRAMTLLQLRREQYSFTAPLFLVLQVAALFVLLLASANLVNLSVARLIERQKELAIRTALGASKWRLTRLFMGETLPLSSLAGAVALAASYLSVNLIRTSIPRDYTKWIGGWDSIRLDLRSIEVALVLTLVVGTLFAIAAAWQSSRRDLNHTLKEGGGRSSTGFGGNRLRGVLAMAQMVFATVLLIGAGLMVQGFFRLSDVYKTFDPHQVLTMRVSLPEKQFPDDVSRRAFYQQLLPRLSALPGVQVAGMVANPPASNVDSPTTLFVREGHAVLNANQAPSADIQSASSDFFSTLHIAVLDGRALSEQDGAQSPQVAVISRTLARHYWGQDSPIGQKIKLGAPNSAAPWTTIVGVVEDVKQNWWDGTPRPVIYLPYTQAPRRTMEVVVRTSANPLTVAPSVRQAMRSLAPDVSAAGLGPMERSISDSLAPLRILGVLMVLFG